MSFYRGLLFVSIIAVAVSASIGNGYGDPQFVGFHDQQFQIHGYPETWFDIINTPAFNVNAKFVYLASGTCEYNNTQCWTHPGTYMGEFGIAIADRHTNAVVARISVAAGSHAAGLTVTVNDKKFPLGAVANMTADIVITRPSQDVVRIIATPFTLELTNADDFINMGTSLTPTIIAAGAKLVDMNTIQGYKQTSVCKQGSYPELHIHGLLGQTWRNAVYGSGRLYEGSVDDYVCSGQFNYDSLFHKLTDRQIRVVEGRNDE